jgi:transcriptional regulator with XRE-family HTH domain
VQEKTRFYLREGERQMDQLRDVFAERFAEWLWTVRREYGSRRKLAQALGVTETSVMNWEHGTVPDGWSLVRLLVELRPVLDANPALMRWGREVLFGIGDEAFWEAS